MTSMISSQKNADENTQLNRWAIYDDNTPMRNKRRDCYKVFAIINILIDLIFQLTIYTSLYCLYLFSLIQEEKKKIEFIEDIYNFFFFGKRKFAVRFETLTQINNVAFLLLPTLITIWTKSIVGLRAWYNDFTRQTVESYFIFTFIYNIFVLLSNSLMLTMQPKLNGSFIITNLLSTLVLGTFSTLSLYKFLQFLDRDMRLHQALWCGSIMDAEQSDPGEKDLEVMIDVDANRSS